MARSDGAHSRTGLLRPRNCGHDWIPITGYAEHTVDLSFQSVPGNPVEVFVSLEPGLHLVVFRSITLQAELVIIDAIRI